MLGGIVEDVTQRVSVRYRLGLTIGSALLLCWLLDLGVSRTGIAFVDGWLQAWPYAAMLFAAFAIGGLPHAFNIIDGYNGLAGTVAVLVCLAITHVALQVGDRQLAAMVVCLVGATLGFLIWNYPRGKIFAGDGGAYVWGMVIAVAAVTLVQRHRVVSPWFPMLLLIYPVWETVFSIYRKIARGQSPGDADALHFHQLIFRRIVRVAFADDEARQLLARNNRTSPYLWIFAALTVVPAVLFWNNTPVLMAFCALFVATYVAAYLMIVRFKVPALAAALEPSTPSHNLDVPVLLHRSTMTDPVLNIPPRDKAEILAQALPYIRKFHGKTIVIKYGGNAMTDPALQADFAEDVVLLKLVGMNPVVVHGGGPQIEAALNRLGKKGHFIQGMRVTDSETMEVVEWVLAGEVQQDIVGLINQAGGKAVGLTGRDGGLIRAQKLKMADRNDPNLHHDVGQVGDIVSIDPSVVKALQDDAFIPVVSPIGFGEENESYNINADVVAGKLAPCSRPRS